MNDLPLNALRALAAVEREGGIRPAARRLGISPSAVHRHVKEIESRLGIAVSERHGRQFALTTPGMKIAREAADALARLSRIVDATGQPSRHDRVVVTSTESFAREWLLPRLGDFCGSHPNIEIWLRTGRRFADPGIESTIAIRMGDRASVGNDALRLMDECLVPVCRPAMIETVAAISLEELARLPLLEDFDQQTSWEAFGRAHAVGRHFFRPGMRIGSSSLVLDAAEQGLGIGLGRGALAHNRIQQGRLLALDQFAIDLGTSYWVVKSPNMRASGETFVDWLYAQPGTLS